MTITIDNLAIGWRVTCADRWEDGLDSGEALWVVANLLIKPDGTAPFLRTAEQHAAWEAKHGPTRPLEAWQRELGPGSST